MPKLHDDQVFTSGTARVARGSPKVVIREVIREIPVDRFIVKQVPRELTEEEKKQIFLEYMIKLRSDANQIKKQKLVSKREQVLSFITVNGTVTMRELRNKFSHIPKTSMQRIVDELTLFGKIEKGMKNNSSIFKVII